MPEDLTDHAGLLSAVTALAGSMRARAAEAGDALAAIPAGRRASAENLLHYLALRAEDRRALQLALAASGLSSLGRSEAHALFTVEKVLAALRALAGGVSGLAGPGDGGVSMAQAHATLDANTRTLLGPPPESRRSRVMVTLSTEAATDHALHTALLAAGTDLVRINCAHDTPEAWKAMIAHARSAGQRRGRPVRVMMDLPGPKARTGPLREGPRVVRWSPVRGVVGDIERPALVFIFPEDVSPMRLAGALPQGARMIDAVLPLPAPFIESLRPSETLEFRDHRGAERDLKVVGMWETGGVRGVLAEGWRTSYLTPGCVLRVRGDGRSCAVTALPPTESSILLRTGEAFRLTRDQSHGEPETRTAEGAVITPGSVPFTLPEAFDDLRVGERVMLDDGKAAGVIETLDKGGAIVRITRAPAAGLRLRADKGVNLPDSALRVPSLPAEDVERLAFIAENADIVGLSFARGPEDLRGLRERLRDLGASHLGVVLKVETRAAFDRLPELLLELLHFPSCGVMIARGDLAVEMGWERLAEAQEEVLWLCESAHVPVIWATQVLESLAKKGLASRSEITDAAAGQRAECVMLNKGPNVVEAVRTLDTILRRMDAHQMKKRAMLRPLSVATRFFGCAAGVTGAR